MFLGVFCDFRDDLKRSEKGYWRRERDSNPRRALTLTPLAGVRLRPLGHLSAPWETLVSACLAGGEPGWPASGAAMILKRPTRSKVPQRSPTSGAEPRAHEFLP